MALTYPIFSFPTSCGGSSAFFSLANKWVCKGNGQRPEAKLSPIYLCRYR